MSQNEYLELPNHTAESIDITDYKLQTAQNRMALELKAMIANHAECLVTENNLRLLADHYSKNKMTYLGVVLQIVRFKNTPINIMLGIRESEFKQTKFAKEQLTLILSEYGLDKYYKMGKIPMSTDGGLSSIQNDEKFWLTRCQSHAINLIGTS